MAFTPDGQLALSASDDGRWLLRDAATGRVLRVHQQVRGAFAVWQPDSPDLVDASENAWPWLVAQIRDEQDPLVALWPAQALVSLPPPRKAA